MARFFSSCGKTVNDLWFITDTIDQSFRYIVEIRG